MSVYLDSAANVRMSDEVRHEMTLWGGNPSQECLESTKFIAMRTAFEELVAKIAKINVVDYNFIWTSGGSEANCMVLKSVPLGSHVITSAVEHKSVLLTLEYMQNAKLIELTILPVMSNGSVSPESIGDKIRPNTKLVCIQGANNETGVCNDLEAIRAVTNGVMLHCDAVQSFGKYGIAADIDSFSISFHKLGGPTGVGLLVCKKTVTLVPLIFGTQNGGLRGGTENVPGIAASYLACRTNFESRTKKNSTLADLRRYLISSFASHMVMSYDEYRKSPRNGIVVIGDLNDKSLPHILLVAVVANGICNTRIRKYLASKDIIISVGSACNTSSKSASHVLEAIGADASIKAGALRVSFSDSNIRADIDKFLRELNVIVQEQVRQKSTIDVEQKSTIDVGQKSTIDVGQKK